MKLRPYQNNAVQAVEAEWREHKSTLVVMPTGTGKTVTFAEIIRRAFPRRALVLTHREVLVNQAADKIRKMTGWRVDIEMGAQRAEMACMFGGPRVVCSTIQTQASGGDGGGRMTRFDPRLFGTIIIDEGHHGTSSSYKKVLDWYINGNPDIRILGVTATPDRADEEALGQIYESVAFDYEITDAISDGWLVPVVQKMVHVDGLDFSSCRTTAGDLNGADLARVMEDEKMLHKVVSPAIDIIGNRRTLVFAASVVHAERMAELFNRHRPGMAAWVCGKTDPDERKRIESDFATGKIQTACNCAIWTEGYDNPCVEAVIMKNTKSRSSYAQMAGRAMRPHDSIAHELNNHDSPEARRALIEASPKPFCEIIDFFGVSGRHKLVTSADILGGNVSERVRELAVAKAKEGQPIRMDQALEAAIEEEKEEKRQAEIKEIAQRARLVAKAKYSIKNVNPFDVFEVAPAQSRGWDSGKKLTEAQENVLIKQGINLAGLAYAQQKQLLNECFRRWDQGLCTFGQAKILRKRGISTNCTRDEAAKQIDEIAKRENWVKK